MHFNDVSKTDKSTKDMKTKGQKAVFYISIISLILAVVAIYVNWQSTIFVNRPYVKIIPVAFKDKKFYFVRKFDSENFGIVFKFRLKNIGSAPANDIDVKHTVYLWDLGEIKESEIKSENLKKILEKLKRSSSSEYIEFYKGELVKENLDEVTEKFIEKFGDKDIVFSRLYLKWKKLALFPGDSLEYENGIKLSGKNAYQFVQDIDSQAFNMKLKVFYWGILPKIGRPYHSFYNADFDNGKMIPYEVENY